VFTDYSAPVYKITGDPSDKAANITALNQPAKALHLTDEGCAALRRHARDAYDAGKARIAEIVFVVPEDTGSSDKLRRKIEFLAVPNYDGSILLIGRDRSHDEMIRDALTQSRGLYKDLTELASDFAWETDHHGRFSFISPKGAIGYRPDQLVGEKPNALLAHPMSVTGRLPFSPETPVRHVDIWLRNAAGEPRCIMVSALPLVDEDGRRVGARGLGLDVTSERIAQTELAQSKHREDLVRYWQKRQRLSGQRKSSSGSQQADRKPEAQSGRSWRYELFAPVPDGLRCSQPGAPEQHQDGPTVRRLQRLPGRCPETRVESLSGHLQSYSLP